MVSFLYATNLAPAGAVPPVRQRFGDERLREVLDVLEGMRLVRRGGGRRLNRDLFPRDEFLVP